MIFEAVYLRCDEPGCDAETLARAESVYPFKYGRVIKRVHAPAGWAVALDEVATPAFGGEMIRQEFRVRCPGHAGAQEGA
jgi:hypothetical protein